MLILEIAAGVFLGMLIYRALDSYSRNFNLALPAAIFSLICSSVVGISLGLLGLGVGFFIYYFVAHPAYFARHRSEEYWGMALIVVLGLGIALRSDIMAGREAKKLATKCVCEKCGEVGLRFRTFKGSLTAKGGEEHAHPTGTCPRCGHEQELTLDRTRKDETQPSLW